MRILHVVPCLDPDTGGPALIIPGLCRALRALGLDVSLYTLGDKHSAVTVRRNAEPFPIHWFKPFPGSRWLPTVAFYRRLRRDLAQFDLVHLHSLWNPVISMAGLACRRAGVPYILCPLGMLQEDSLRRKERLKRAYHSAMEYRTLRGAAALHFFTEAEMSDSPLRLRGTKPCFVIPCGVDPFLTRNVVRGEFRKSFPDLEGKRIMLFLGRLHWSKGLELQVEALALLVKDFPTLIWVLVGPDEGEWDLLSRRIAVLGLQRQVLWTGLLPNQRCIEALGDADVFVLTSRHEAHSLAMNEALASGVPVVVTDTVRFDEIETWGAGRVTARNARELASAIAFILSHPEQAKQMREAGLRMVAERLAWPKVASAMVCAYEKVLFQK